MNNCNKICFDLWNLITLSITIAIASAHVAIQYPQGRTDNDYLYTFDGTCNGNSCNNFCGDPYDPLSNPYTILPVGVSFTVRWYSPVPHVPYQYRLSLNKQNGSTMDDNFDHPDNILIVVDAAAAAAAAAATSDESSSSRSDSTSSRQQRGNHFATQVTIPMEALDNCTDLKNPCVMQLYDLYYFVKCANIVLTDKEAEVTPDAAIIQTINEKSNPDDVCENSDTISTIHVQAASFTDYQIAHNGNQSSLDPTLSLHRCRTYRFCIDAPGHPFVIKTTPGEKLVESVPSQGLEQGVFEWTIPSLDTSTPFELYYQCTLHPEMRGRIELVDTLTLGNGSCPDEDQSVSSSSTRMNDYIATRNRIGGSLITSFIWILFL